jgi:two-component system, OmpR family, sensor histidine kinase MtrB
MRARVTLLFLIAGLLLATALGLLTYSLARNQLSSQRENVAIRQAFLNARLVRDLLRTKRLDNQAVIKEVRPDSGGGALYHFNVDGNWFSQNSTRFNQSDLPEGLRDEVLAGGTGRQRYVLHGEPYLAVGVDLAEFDIQYFEIFPLSQLARSLRVVGGSLILGSAVAALLAAAVGWSASRRVLRPLSRVATAASDLASGGLDTRLEPEQDPDLDRLVTSFNDMADAVQDRIEREARFASDVSHELRSPITALSAAVEVLDGRRDELPERSQQALDVVVNQVHRFDQMVLDLLELSRLEAGVEESHQEPVVLADTVRRIIARNGCSGVPFDASRRSETPILLDRRRLERIVVNLLDNAKNHAGGPARVALEDGPRNSIRLAVEDAGPGVSPSERDRVFERFYRGTEARRSVGTGLGLAIVSEHASAMGGRAWVEDRRGGGARFVVSLPAVRT